MFLLKLCMDRNIVLQKHYFENMEIQFVKKCQIRFEFCYTYNFNCIAYMYCSNPVWLHMVSWIGHTLISVAKVKIIMR